MITFFLPGRRLDKKALTIDQRPMEFFKRLLPGGYAPTSPDSTGPRCEFCPTPAGKYPLKKMVPLICSQMAASAVESMSPGCCAFWLIIWLTCEPRTLLFTCEVTTPSGHLAWKAAGATGLGNHVLYPAPVI